MLASHSHSHELLHHLMWLLISAIDVIALQKLSAAAKASLRALTNLRQLGAKPPLTPDLLVTLQSLHALTQLHLVGCLCADNSAMVRILSNLNFQQPSILRATLPVILLMTTHGSSHRTGG